jgi:serine/threonine protein phosphatase 1
MKKPYRAVHHYRRNTTGRDLVVGDVHGCFSLLDATLAAHGYDPERDRLFSVGDLINRGPESARVLDAVRRHRLKAVLGNHEDMLVRWYFGGTGASERLLANGAGWFMDLADGSGKARPIARFMGNLPYAIQIDTAHGLVGLLHADAPRDQWGELVAALGNEDRDGLTRKKVLWQRARWTEQAAPEFAPVPASLAALFGLPATGPAAPVDQHRRVQGVAAVIVGHTPVSAPVVRGNVINIDTGAVYGGRLTVLDLAELPLLLAHEPAWRA